MPVDRVVVRILEPASGSVVPVESAEQTVLRLEVDPPSLSGDLFVSLDMHEARRWTPSARVAEFLPPGATWSEGLHRIVAFVRGPDRQVVPSRDGEPGLAVAWISLGSSALPPPEVSLFVACPQGSYSGPKQARFVPLGAHLIGERSDRSLTVQLVGPGVAAPHDQTIVAGQPYALENLANGDYTLRFEIADRASRPPKGLWSRAERTIVVNGDTPDDSTSASNTAILPPGVSQ